MFYRNLFYQEVNTRVQRYNYETNHVTGICFVQAAVTFFKRLQLVTESRLVSRGPASEMKHIAFNTSGTTGYGNIMAQVGTPKANQLCFCLTGEATSRYRHTALLWHCNRHLVMRH